MMRAPPQGTSEWRTEAATTLEERVVALEERVEMLEMALGLDYEAPPHFGLTLSEARILGFLRKRQVMSRERIMSALYADAPDPPGATVINVYISKIRRKLEPFGIRIRNMHGVGYYLTRESRLALQAANVPD